MLVMNIRHSILGQSNCSPICNMGSLQVSQDSGSASKMNPPDSATSSKLELAQACKCIQYYVHAKQMMTSCMLQTRAAYWLTSVIARSGRTS